MKKKTHEEYLAEFNKSQAGKLELISTYKSGHDKVTVRCLVHGNTFERVAKVFVGKGKGECSLCKKERVSKTHSDWLGEFNNQEHSTEYTILSEYVNRDTPIKIKHNDCGHEWEGNAYHLVNGTKCPKCVRKQPTTTKNDINLFLQDLTDTCNDKFKLISEFVNYTTPVNLECTKCGYIISKKPYKIHSEVDGCAKCMNKLKVTPSEFNTRLCKMHSDRFVLLSDYESNKQWIRVTDTTCGHSFGVISRELLRRDVHCKVCSKSTLETSIIDYMKSIYAGEFIYGDRTILNGKELDVFIPSLNLAIEINGNYWHSDQFKTRQYHQEKTTKSFDNGIKLIHIYSHQWLNQRDKVKSILNYHLKAACIEKIYARKLRIREFTKSEEKDFFNANHMQNNCIGSLVRIGLVDDNNDIICAMNFSKPRFNKDYEWELLRFASKLNTSVAGGASRILSYFIKKYKPSNILSYANLDISDGNLYETLGFSFERVTEPSYFYVKTSNTTEVVVNRLSLTKQKMKLIEGFKFNPELSEYENARLNNYHRVWNSGNLVYTLNFN